MSNPEFKPFVPADSDLKEFTFKALFLGVLVKINTMQILYKSAQIKINNLV